MADSPLLRLSPGERAVWEDYTQANDAIQREAERRLDAATTDAECKEVVEWVAGEVEQLLDRFHLLLAIIRAERPSDG